MEHHLIRVYCHSVVMMAKHPCLLNVAVSVKQMTTYDLTVNLTIQEFREDLFFPLFLKYFHKLIHMHKD